MAVNSDPKVDASTEFCLLLNQMIGATLQNVSQYRPHDSHLRSNAPTYNFLLESAYCWGLPLWRPYKIMSSRNAGIDSRGWMDALDQMPISSSDVTSGSQICETPALDARLWASLGDLKATILPVGCQRVRSLRPTEVGR
jgi:hypothetical protein